MADVRLACLVKIQTTNQIRTHFIARDEFTVGRSMEADLTLPDLTVSRQHAKVILAETHIQITDLGSNNGTFLNGEQIAQGSSISVTNKDVVRFGVGESEMRFTLIFTPVELMAPNEQKIAMAAAMNLAMHDIEAHKRQILEAERDRVAVTVKAEAEELRKQLQEELAQFKMSQEGKIKRETAEAQRRHEIAVHQAEAHVKLLKEQLAENLRQEQSALEKKIEELETKARTIAHTIEQDARQKAALTIQEASVTAQNEIKSATEIARGLTREAQTKSNQKIAVAEDEADMALTEARQKAEHLITEAKSQVKLEIDEAKRKAVEDARAQTYAEQDKIVREYRPVISKLSETQKDLESKVSAYRQEASHLETIVAHHKSEQEALEQSNLEKRLAVSKLEEDLEGAQNVLKLAREAQENLDQLKVEIASARQTIENLKAQAERESKRLDDEHQSNKQLSILEYDQFRKNQEEEFAKSRLEELEKLKIVILEEEQKYRRTVSARATEIAASIEERLLPKVKTDLLQQGINASLGNMLDLIRDAVNEVVLNDKPAIRAVTEHLGQDPEKLKRARQKRQRLFFTAAAAALLAVGIYHARIYDWLKNLEGEPEVHQLIAKRNAESIYTPAQTSEWHDTYTDNILHLRYYYEAKSDPVYQEQWALRLNNLELLRSLQLSEDDMVQFIGKERALISKLWELRQTIDAKYLDVGLSAMNQSEMEVAQEMHEVLKTDENFSTVRKMEKDFVLQFIKMKFEKEIRLPAQAN